MPTASVADTFKVAQDLYVPQQMKQHLKNCIVSRVWKNDLLTGKLVLHDDDNHVTPIMAVGDVKIQVISLPLSLSLELKGNKRGAAKTKVISLSNLELLQQITLTTNKRVYSDKF